MPPQKEKGPGHLCIARKGKEARPRIYRCLLYTTAPAKHNGDRARCPDSYGINGVCVRVRRDHTRVLLEFTSILALRGSQTRLLSDLLLNGRESTRLAYGQTYAGRYLLVVLAEAEDGRAYVVTSRDMTVQEIRRFRQKG